MRIDELKASYEKLGAIYPVLVDKHGEVIDGIHRKKVDPNWKELRIDTDDEAVKAIVALVANINRREVAREEITKRVDKIAELTRWNTRRMAAEIGRSESWVLKYISQKYKHTVKSKSGKKGAESKAATHRVAKEVKKEPVKEIKEEETVSTTTSPNETDIGQHENEGEVFDFEGKTAIEEGEKVKNETEKNGVIDEDEMWEKEWKEFCDTYPPDGLISCKHCYQNTHLISGDGVWECELCGAGLCPFDVSINEHPFELPHLDVDEETEEPKSYLFDYLDDPQFTENVWHSDRVRGAGENIYGDPDFHGNTPPVIIFQCLMKYTKEGDKVLDPMAGSGTTIDLCRNLNRGVMAFDIKPLREDVSYGDAVHLELNDESADFIFCHFPYWNMVQYSDNSADLSNLNFNNYLTKIREVFSEFKRVLKREGYCAVLIGDKRKSGLLDLSAHVSLLGSGSFKLHDKIIWVAKKQRSRKGTQSNLTKYRAEKFNYHLQTFDTLLIFRKL